MFLGFTNLSVHFLAVLLVKIKFILKNTLRKVADSTMLFTKYF